MTTMKNAPLLFGPKVVSKTKVVPRFSCISTGWGGLFGTK